MGRGEGRPRSGLTYQVEISRRAFKSLAGLSRPDQQRVRAVIDLLSETPRPRNAVKLSGQDGVYRVRAGNYRILYEVHDARLVVQVVRLGHRPDIYG